MNPSLLNAVKSYAAQNGPDALADAQRVDGALPVFANKAAQAERRAFLACAASGLPARLRQTADASARAACVDRAAQQLSGKAEAPPDLAREIAALVESLCPAGSAPRPAAPSPPPQTPRRSASDAPPTAKMTAAETPVTGTPEAAAPTAKGFTLSKRTVVFAAVAAAAALVATLINDAMFPSDAGTPGEIILEMAFWMGLTTLGIVGAILGAQSFYLKKTPAGDLIAKALIVGAVCGAAAGGVAQAIFNYTQQVSPTVSAVSRVLCWGIAGAGAGIGVSFFVPNYPRDRALLAGLIGGLAGGGVCLLGSGLIGTTLLGFFIGAVIVIAEENLREAWITVDWGHNETVNVSLGPTPVILGSAAKANVYLPKQDYPPEALVVRIENQKIIAENRMSGVTLELREGSVVDLGRVKIIAHKK